jgi:GNAT superfamily N-acetyltransferase
MDEYKVIAISAYQLPESYRPMIYSKWLRSLRYGNDYFKLIEAGSYFTHYHKYLEALLAKPYCVVRLAVLADDYDVVLGFSVTRNSVLDYVHVHKDYRRTGIGTLLVPSGISKISHITRQGMSFWNNRLKECKFDPFI